MLKSKKSTNMKKAWKCDRCGRDKFINGHALGGHKKYCGKSQYSSISLTTKNKELADKKITSTRLLVCFNSPRSKKQAPLIENTDYTCYSPDFCDCCICIDLASICVKEKYNCNCEKCQPINYDLLFLAEE